MSFDYGNDNSKMLGLPTSVTDYGNTVTTSSYDAYNRVIQSAIANWVTIVYTYNSGNLQSVKRSNNASKTQTYSFTHDAFGNTLTASVGSRTLATYTYGARNGKLLRETYGSTTLDFFYDASGTPFALKYAGTVYYYITNLQGDVIRIVNQTGQSVADYEYSPFGEVISATGTLAEINPLRYRGYYYDTESGFYYLSSRYYDPRIGRFLNADDSSYLGANGDFISYNLFAYCHNNPVNMADSGGNLAFFIATGIAGAAIGGIVGYATTGTWKGALAGAAVGAAVGLAGGAGAAYLLAGKATASVGAVAIGTNLQLAGVGTTGYGSFKAFKVANGSAGQGKAWHHIVGQTAENINQFGTQMIHRANNLVRIAHGAGTLHNKITGHYNSIQPYTNGQVVHKWLESQSFRAQYNYGLELLYKTAKELGATIEYAIK